MELTGLGKAKASCCRSESGFVSRKRFDDRSWCLVGRGRSGCRATRRVLALRDNDSRWVALHDAYGSHGKPTTAGKGSVVSICTAPRFGRRSVRFWFLSRGQLQESRFQEQPNEDGPKLSGARVDDERDRAGLDFL